MTSIVAHRSAPLAIGPLLDRVLATPQLAAELQTLAPRELLAIVRRVGLEDAAELVALASTEQLLGVFDEELWRSARPGDAERFDARHFAFWLEVLLEAGDAVVAERLAALPEELVALALGAQILVVPLEDLEARIRDGAGDDEAELLDKRLGDAPTLELLDFLLIARNPDAWDAVITAVLALDRDHHALLERLLHRVLTLTEEYVGEEGGLLAALSADERLATDAAAERSDRRAASGYVDPQDAAAFLALGPSATRDPISAAYFRSFERRPASPRPALPPDSALGRLVEEALVDDPAEARPRQLTAGGGEPAPFLIELLASLAARDPVLADTRRAELAYLANVLVAGGTQHGRRYRPIEAVQAAIAAIERALATSSPVERAAAVERTPLDVLFRGDPSGRAPARSRSRS